MATELNDEPPALSPHLRVHEGGVSVLTRWEGWAESEVAEFIARLLRESPPPQDCPVARDLRKWSALLETDAQSRLAELRPFRLVQGPVA